MKRLLILFLPLLYALIAADNATACSACSRSRHHSHNEGFAVSVGIEFGIDNVNDNDGMEPYIGSIVMYDEALLNGRLNINIGLGYFFEFVKKDDADFNKVFPQILTLDAGLGYNLDLRNTSTLSFLLDSYTDFRLAPRLDNNVVSILSPGIRFSETLGFGGMYAQIGFPLHFPSYDFDMEFTLGWISTFGLGLSLDTNFNLSPKADWGGELGAIVSYSYERYSFYVRGLFKGIGGHTGSRSYWCDDCGEYHGSGGHSGKMSINTSIGFIVSF